MNDSMKKIAVVTGTRAEYGLLRPVLQAITDHPELQLSLIVTGMHLSHEFGHTVQEIERDGFPIDARVDMLLSGDTPSAMAQSIGVGMVGLAQSWTLLKPDVILVLGDRVEPLAAAISGAYMNIPVAHIHGGDVCGNIDDSARHAITKFAHIHFPVTRLSAQRIVKMGEDEWRVHVVGSPALDDMLNEPLLPPAFLEERFGIAPSRPLALIVQHSVTTQVNDAPRQIRETLEAVADVGIPAIMIYPNSDAGGRAMIDTIREYECRADLRTYRSLPRREYLSVMKAASVMVGNSSSGLIDAPSFGVPVVNIGIRQEGRERGSNVINVSHDKHEIVKALKKSLEDSVFLAEARNGNNPYGDGKTGPRIAEILGTMELNDRLLQKKNAY